MTIDDRVEQAHKLAVEHSKNSYAPYSGLHVAAAIGLAGQQDATPGVNVENASYGATICAERSAILSARSQYGEFEVDFIVVISDIKGDPITPCGMCLQVLIEFCDQDTPVYLGSMGAITEMRRLGEFLPHAFSRKDLLRPRP